MKLAIGLTAAALAGIGLWSAGVSLPQFGAGQSATELHLSAQRVTPRTSTPSLGVSADDPVVLELFTSQSCSSCPPADRLLAQLESNPGLVVISRPVTYWDRLGWKDTLGRPENTELQRAYARRGLGGRNGVYTPQVVVDGRQGLVGSSASGIRRLVRQAARTPSPDLTVTARNGGGYTVSVSGRTATPAQLSLVALDSSETIGIGNGENRGRTVTYTNVVRDESAIGRWNGGDASFTVPASRLRTPDADRYAVLVQQGEAGPILAGRYLN